MKFFIKKFLKNLFLISKAGFTLIEAMVATFIIIVGIVAVLQMFPLSVEQQKMGERATIATELAQGKIEEIISKSYDDILAGQSTEDYGAISGFSAYKRVIYTTCVNANSQDVLCSYNPSGDPEPVKKIEVTVYWKSTLGPIEKNLKISTLVAKK